MRRDDRPDPEHFEQLVISAAATPEAAAEEKTCAKVPRSCSYPRSASTWRRRRIAAFCSAILSSWNQSPWTGRVRASNSGLRSLTSRSPRSTGTTSGCRSRTSCNSNPARSSTTSVA
jgi:hypothetical protein